MRKGEEEQWMAADRKNRNGEKEMEKLEAHESHQDPH